MLRLKTVRRPPIYPNGAQAISPVAFSPPSAVLTPSIGVLRWMRAYFSKSEEDVYLPKPIGNFGIYASCQGAGSLLEMRAGRVVELFGCPTDSIVIQTR